MTWCGEGTGQTPREALAATCHTDRKLEAHTFAGETFDVEVLGLDPEHLSLARFPAFMAVNGGLLGWVVRVLRVGHWKKKKRSR